MDAYVFIRTEPGLAGAVMDLLVEARLAERVVAVAGDVDLVARVEGLEMEALSSRLIEGVHRVPGIREMSTAFVVSPEKAGFGIGPWPMPFRGMKWPRFVSLVLVRIQAGAGADVMRAVRSSKRVMGMALLTGKNDLMVQVGGPSLESVARTVLRELHTLAGVASTETMPILRATPGKGGGAEKRRAPSKRKTAKRQRTARSRRR